MVAIELPHVDPSSLKLDNGGQSRDKENEAVSAPYSGSFSFEEEVASARKSGTGPQELPPENEPYKPPSLRTLSIQSYTSSSSRPSLSSEPLFGERSASEHASERQPSEEILQHKPEQSETSFGQMVRARLEREVRAREEYTATTEQFKYGRLQEAGLLRLQWIEHPSVSDCPIFKSTLTFDAFHQMIPSGNVRTENIASDMEDYIVGLGLPNEFVEHVEESVYRAFDYTSVRGEMQWVGRTGPGVIFLEVLESKKGFPHISDITLAFYKRDFPIDTLKYIFVCIVVQPETLNFVRDLLYPANSIPWPNDKPQAWSLGTPEYEALLGTRIGKMVAYTVLGGFNRGTRRIKQILSWPTAQGFVNLRFDIEPSEKEPPEKEQSVKTNWDDSSSSDGPTVSEQSMPRNLEVHGPEAAKFL
ncbi:hypothetical protein N7526_003769 [Penicillium atrosanguineum]|nr:hypothetical protein N7526_003769 [Penicillium atrosanguineum]